jgi:hypothetical protein
MSHRRNARRRYLQRAARVGQPRDVALRLWNRPAPKPGSWTLQISNGFDELGRAAWQTVHGIRGFSATFDDLPEPVEEYSAFGRAPIYGRAG